ALGYGLAGAAAAAIANETAKRVSPSHSSLDILGKRMHLNNPFGKRGFAGNLFSTPLIYNLGGAKSVKRPWLRSALLGLGAGLGSLALPRQKRSFWRKSGIARETTPMTIGRLLAGGLAVAVTSRLLNQVLRRRHPHDRRHLHDQFE